ncbi:MAG: paraquat-inducible protein A [Gammaproteobacteria bacterium]|nr:paraquat-inducible protein A [Gammaproteobacteria bacterium]
MQKTIGLVLLLCAYILLIPGLTQPMLSVQGTVERQKLVEVGRDIIKENQSGSSIFSGLAEMVIDNIKSTGTINAFDKTQSILGTAKQLYESNHIPVALLILLFSVVIPLLKGLLVLATQFALSEPHRTRVARFNSAISKWSMADVFVVAIFVAYLAVNGMQESTGLVDFDASLGNGFYYFLGYCLLAILATQILYWRSEPVSATLRVNNEA